MSYVCFGMLDLTKIIYVSAINSIFKMFMLKFNFKDNYASILLIFYYYTKIISIDRLGVWMPTDLVDIIVMSDLFIVFV